MQPTNRWLAAVFIVAGVPASAQAASVDAHVETGIEYDSNLNVDELDQASNKSDQALLLGAGAEASGQPLENLTLTGTYDFTSRRYESNDSFDQDIHLASVDLSYDIDSVTLGASHHYSYATLASEPFLDYNRTSVYLGKLIDDDVYVMGSLLSKRKSFENSEARDARTRGISLDSFFFSNQGRTLFVLGLDGDDENAASDAYDYQMLAGRTRLKHRFDVSGHENTVQVGLRYEARDYDEEISSAEAPLLPLAGPATMSSETRSDRILTVDLRWAVGLTDWLTTEAKVERTESRSSLDSADYDKTIASLTLRADF
jgi:predicted porin